jgi:hypothetical protein
MGGDRRDTDAGSEVEVCARREREDAFSRHDGELLGGASCRAAVTGNGDPHPIAHGEAGNTDADRVDHAGAVVVGHRRLRGPAAVYTAARLPVRGDAGIAVVTSRRGVRGRTASPNASC